MTPANPCHWAEHYAASLLRDLRCPRPIATGPADHPALVWRRSFLAEVTGWSSGRGMMGPAALAAAADGALLAFNALSGGPTSYAHRGSALLGERARRMTLSRQGSTSPGGSCRLLPARDGFITINLARPEDHAAIPAWLESTAIDWVAEVSQCATHDLLARGRLLGLAVAALDEPPPAWHTEQSVGIRALPRARPPVVLDFSSLWAGPLAGALLASAGAQVLKVESTARPDGARAGNEAFFDRLNGGKPSVVIDFGSAEGRAALRRLIAGADIVLESARPRAWRHLGLDAAEMVAAHPGLSWISITAHGREGDAENWVGFGDDCAIAGGVGRAMAQAYGQAIFAGDAIADPLTGLHAACAAWAAWLRGGGSVVGLSLAGVVTRAIALGAGWPTQLADWSRLAARDTAPLYALPEPVWAARALGADTRAALAA
jgi:hypothetical protein